MENIISEASKLACICLVGFLAACNAAVSNADIDAGIAACGPKSPSYVYFAEIAPTLSHQGKYAADTSIAFKLDFVNAMDYFEPPLDIFSASRPQVYFRNSNIDEFFKPDEIECWAEQGDQLAALQLSRGSALERFSKVAAVHRKNKLDFAPPMFLNSNFLENWRIQAEWAERAAEHRDDFCPVGYVAGWRDLTQCQPNKMLAVFENGVPGAHYTSWQVYAHGPKDFQNAAKAERHRVLYLLQGGLEHYGTLFTCENLNVVRDDDTLKELFFERLDQEAFFPDGIAEPSKRTSVRRYFKERLRACP